METLNSMDDQTFMLYNFSRNERISPSFGGWHHGECPEIDVFEIAGWNLKTDRVALISNDQQIVIFLTPRMRQLSTRYSEEYYLNQLKQIRWRKYYYCSFSNKLQSRKDSLKAWEKKTSKSYSFNDELVIKF